MFMRIADKSDDARIHILQGNHDYSDPDNPTLGFLPLIAGRDIWWYGKSDSNIAGRTKSDHHVAMMPFCRGVDDFKSTLNRVPELEYTAAFFHQTFAGAQTSSGMEMDGIPAALAKSIDAKRYFAGDIHVPQKIGGIEYIGSPYQIRFGDEFDGRVLAYDVAEDKIESLRFETIRKRTLTIASPKELLDLDVREGDQLKLRMTMSRADFSGWKGIEAEIVDAVRARGAELYGVEITEAAGDAIAADDVPAASTDPRQIFGEFCDANNIDDDLKSFGEEYLE